MLIDVSGCLRRNSSAVKDGGRIGDWVIEHNTYIIEQSMRKKLNVLTRRVGILKMCHASADSKAGEVPVSALDSTQSNVE